MFKKFMQLALILSALAFAVWGALYVKKSGMFEPYPDEIYLTADEEETRPLYLQLSDKEKALYTALYRGVQNYEREIALPYDADGEDYTRLYMLLEKQEGGLFYIDSTFYTAQKLRTAQIVYRTESETERNEMQTELKMKVDNIISKIPENAGEYEKALFIHDYIIENCRYEVDEGGGYGATAYGCLVNGSAHCEGYTKAYSYLLAECGIRSTVVTGVTGEGENHAWNQIEIGGHWYNSDITWDDTDVKGEKNHLYFMCADDEFCAEPQNASGQVHVPQNNSFLPFVCTDQNDYYVREDLHIKNMADAERIIRRENQEDCTSIELKFNSSKLYDEFKLHFIEEQRIFDILTENRTPILGGNISVSLRENKDKSCITLIIQ